MAGSMIPNAIGPSTKSKESLGDILARKKDEDRLNAFQLSQNWILYGTAATKPAFGIANRIYITTDATPIEIWLDTGTAWLQVA